jgi:1,4-dihydroxy-2-naphthoate octaprenyltransferase
MAARPKTLTAALAPVLVGTAIAFDHGSMKLFTALLSLLGAYAIQIGTNFANDYYDAKNGADTPDRLGPTRVTASGLIRPEEVKAAMWIAFGFAAFVGLYLVGVGGWPIVLIGLLGIASGIAYTGGPWPLGYNGLGDVFVFVWFGVIATMATHYLQVGEWSSIAFWSSVPIGALSTAILVVNNLRDAATDRVAGKRTVVVRFGEWFGRVQYLACVGVAVLLPLGLMGAESSVWFGLPLVMTKHLWRLYRRTFEPPGPQMNVLLADTAKALLVYSVLLSVAWALP